MGTARAAASSARPAPATPPGTCRAAGSFGDYSDDDFVKPRKKRRWLKRSFFGILALAVVGGGLYSGYRWTQTQYYVGSNDDHVALYRGISQDLAWISLSKVEKDHPEIELKYLPPYQQKLVEATIAEGGLSDAEKKITELSTQASACKKNAERREAADNNAKTGEGEAAWSHGNHEDLPHVQGHTVPDVEALDVPDPDPDRTHTVDRPQPLGGGAGTGLTVR